MRETIWYERVAKAVSFDAANCIGKVCTKGRFAVREARQANLANWSMKTGRKVDLSVVVCGKTGCCC